MKKLLPILFVIASGCTKGKSNEGPQGESPTLIGGREADPKDWPASVYASMGNASCTATVVGPEVLLIAAHCVDHGGTAKFAIGPNQYTSKCSRSPLYRQGVDHDLALCKIATPVKGIAYENLNQNPDLLNVGDEILLTGYGCIRPGGGGGNDGIYRIGEAKIIRLANPYDYTARGQAALCFGDSGGPAFYYTDAQKTKRVQITVNSKGDIRTTSYLTSVATKASQDFFASWSTANNVKMCGVHEGIEGCRDSVPKPPPPPQPEPTCKDLYNKLGSCLKDQSLWYE